MMYYFSEEKLIFSYRGPTFEGEYEGKGIIEFDDGNYFRGSFISGEATGFCEQHFKNETKYANFIKDKKVGMAWTRKYFETKERGGKR